MKLVVLPSALGDLAAGFNFYQSQSEGVGDYFRRQLAAEIESLREIAGVHRKILGYHRALSKRFPYAIYYTVTDNAVTIHAILDLRRNPERIRRRLQ